MLGANTIPSKSAPNFLAASAASRVLMPQIFIIMVIRLYSGSFA
ncbi:hypothetical protein SpAn4DRAFT_0745 [Sporomusa ovata]|uniref:Uncharacterized protein n=1 Tax=Sporomusa ovata TaxID=2378 RepID=A0A0U1L565_9FIRM|nr:hypothetical protein SpAn4DRAFT_0745 [Sporomusa ovata]